MQPTNGFSPSLKSVIAAALIRYLLDITPQESHGASKTAIPEAKT
jgi:hypothetical protein